MSGKASKHLAAAKGGKHPVAKAPVAKASSDDENDVVEEPVKIEGFHFKDYTGLLQKYAKLEAEKEHLETSLAEANSKIEALEQAAQKPAPISLSDQDLKTMYTAFLEHQGKPTIDPSFYEKRIDNLKIWNQRLIYCSSGLGLVTICACVFARISQY